MRSGDPATSTAPPAFNAIESGAQSAGECGHHHGLRNWTLIGPQPTDAGSTYVTAGRVNAIAIDPRSNKTYTSARRRAGLENHDGGANWLPLTDAQVSLATGAIALDPNNPDTVYVGTGEENFAGDSYYGAGF